MQLHEVFPKMLKNQAVLTQIGLETINAGVVGNVGGRRVNSVQIFIVPVNVSSKHVIFRDENVWWDC